MYNPVIFWNILWYCHPIQILCILRNPLYWKELNESRNIRYECEIACVLYPAPGTFFFRLFSWSFKENAIILSLFSWNNHGKCSYWLPNQKFYLAGKALRTSWSLTHSVLWLGVGNGFDGKWLLYGFTPMCPWTCSSLQQHHSVSQGFIGAHQLKFKIELLIVNIFSLYLFLR